MKVRVLALGLITAVAVSLVAVGTAGARHKHVGVSGSISIIGVWSGPEEKRFQAGIDDLVTDFLLTVPAGKEARAEDRAEAAVDPDQAALVVLQVQHLRAARQRARLDDRIELLVDQPRHAARNDIDAQLARQVPQPVNARGQEARELAVAEDETCLVGANLVAAKEHGRSPCNKAPTSGRGEVPVVVGFRKVVRFCRCEGRWRLHPDRQ